ncbi:MAG: hypothetical protein V4722_22080 [Bacteroidota bacterium]
METITVDEKLIDLYANIINALPPDSRLKVIDKINKPVGAKTKEEKERAFLALSGSFNFDTTPEDLIKEIESSRTISEVKTFDS